MKNLRNCIISYEVVSLLHTAFEKMSCFQKYTENLIALSESTICKLSKKVCNQNIFWELFEKIRKM